MLPRPYKTVKFELEAYGGELLDKPEIVALSQIDVLDQTELKKKQKALAKASGQTPLLLSAVVGTGMTETLRALRDIIVAAQDPGGRRTDMTPQRKPLEKYRRIVIKIGSAPACGSQDRTEEAMAECHVRRYCGLEVQGRRGPSSSPPAPLRWGVRCSISPPAR